MTRRYKSWNAVAEQRLEQMIVVEGKSHREAAKALRMSQKQVKGKAQRMKLSSGHIGARKTLDRDMLRAAAEAYDGGQTWVQIGQAHGKDPAAIRMAVARWRREQTAPKPEAEAQHVAG